MKKTKNLNTLPVDTNTSKDIQPLSEFLKEVPLEFTQTDKDAFDNAMRLISNLQERVGDLEVRINNEFLNKFIK